MPELPTREEVVTTFVLAELVSMGHIACVANWVNQGLGLDRCDYYEVARKKIEGTLDGAARDARDIFWRNGQTEPRYPTW